MTQARSGDQVQVHYTGRLADGTIFDSSANREPLAFTLGAGDMIPGFEHAVLGMSIGDTKTTIIAAADAYGFPQPERIIEVERHHMPPDLQPHLGQELQMRRRDGGSMTVVITAITEEHVTLDANHPLAGKDLTFDITLVAIA